MSYVSDKVRLMTGFSKLSTKGQAVIPAKVREELGLVPGTTIYWDIKQEKGGKKIVAEPVKSNFLDLYGSIKSPFKNAHSWKHVERKAHEAAAKNAASEGL